MLLLIPLLLVLPNYFGTDGVWLSMPISDAISSILAGILLFLQFRSFARKHREELGIDNR
jgi:Na+-driven multidrug efflux pump